MSITVKHPNQVTAYGSGAVSVETPLSSRTAGSFETTTVNASSVAERTTAGAITAGVSTTVAPDTNFVSGHVGMYCIVNAYSDSAELGIINSTSAIGPAIGSVFNNSHPSGVPIEIFPDGTLRGAWYGIRPDNSTNYAAELFTFLEQANAVTDGTWKTGGDSVEAERTRFWAELPIGQLVVDEKIPIRFGDVALGGAGYNTLMSRFGRRASLVAGTAVTDALIEIDTTYKSYHFSLYNTELNRKTNRNGHGIELIGNTWAQGMHIKGCLIKRQDNALDMTDGTDQLANLVVENCNIYANEYGIYSTRFVTIGHIRDNKIWQNVSGGIYLGGKNLLIVGNDFEGQPRPVQIKGSNNTWVTIRNNYFETHSVGDACIDCTNLKFFSIRENMFSTSGITIPRVKINVGQDGEVGDRSILINCHDVYAPTFKVETNGQFSATWNMSRTKRVPPFIKPTGDIFGGTNQETLNGKAYYGTDLGAAAYRTILTSTVPLASTYTNTSYIFAAFYIKYTDDIPASTQIQALVYGRRTSDSTYEECASAMLFLVPTDTVATGDTLFLIGASKVTGANTYDAIRLYIYPYSQTTTTYDGAWVSRVAAFASTNVDFDWFSPIDSMAV